MNKSLKLRSQLCELHVKKISHRSYIVESENKCKTFHLGGYRYRQILVITEDNAI